MTTTEPIRVLILHQNFPGQFRHLLWALAQDPRFQLLGIGQQRDGAVLATPPNVPVLRYPAPAGAGDKTHPYIREFEAAVRRGQAVARVCLDLAGKGYRPHLVLAHPAWGDALFVKDIFPEARLLGLFEFFYRPAGADVGFDPEWPRSVNDVLRVRIKNTVMLHALAACDQGISPTRWQHSQYPAEARRRIVVLHEGIRTDLATPGRAPGLTLPSGVTLTRATPIITYVARNLEPHRGFHVLMRALPELLDGLPEARVAIVGGDGVSYGLPPKPPHRSYRAMLLAEVGERIDAARVHFCGQLPYASYLELLGLSTLHVYLTYPFVLSWSMLEAMSCGCVVLASATAPVTEVVQDGVNGFLFDFFDAAGLARRAIELVRRREELDEIRAAARRTVVERYDFRTVSLPAYRHLLEQAASRPSPGQGDAPA